jgi:hypothetical protein
MLLLLLLWKRAGREGGGGLRVRRRFEVEVFEGGGGERNSGARLGSERKKKNVDEFFLFLSLFLSASVSLFLFLSFCSFGAAMAISSPRRWPRRQHKRERGRDDEGCALLSCAMERLRERHRPIERAERESLSVSLLSAPRLVGQAEGRVRRRE